MAASERARDKYLQLAGRLTHWLADSHRRAKYRDNGFKFKTRIDLFASSDDEPERTARLARSHTHNKPRIQTHSIINATTMIYLSHLTQNSQTQRLDTFAEAYIIRQIIISTPIQQQQRRPAAIGFVVVVVVVKQSPPKRAARFIHVIRHSKPANQRIIQTFKQQSNLNYSSSHAITSSQQQQQPQQPQQPQQHQHQQHQQQQNGKLGGEQLRAQVERSCCDRKKESRRRATTAATSKQQMNSPLVWDLSLIKLIIIISFKLQPAQVLEEEQYQL